MLQRFPNRLEKFIYLYEEKVVEDLEQLIEVLHNEGKKSIKLVAEPIWPLKNEDGDASIIISLSSN